MYLLIIEAVVSLAYAYAAVQNANSGGDYLAQLQLIQNYLADISRKLDEIKSKLVDIELAIERLPVQIRGQIDDALARDALGISNSICQRLNDYMRPAYIKQSLPAMLMDINALQDQIWRVKAAKGIAGLFLTSPLVATWLSARITYEKASLKFTPGHVLDSPWLQSFMKDSKSEYDEGYIRLSDTMDFFTTWVRPHDPTLDARQKVIIHGTEYYFEEDPRGMYRIHGMLNTTLQRYDIVQWTDVNMAVPGRDTQAVAAWQLELTHDRQYREFEPVYRQLQERRQKIYDSFVEPANFWT